MGHHLVVMPRFEPHEFLRLITEHRVTYLATVPTVMQRLLPVYRADPDAYDLSSIRRFWHLAAPCPPVVKRAWIDILGPEVVWELYGGTELQALTFITGTQWLRHPGSVGVVVAGEMKVLDDDGVECPPGVVGEIYMRPAPGSRPTYRYVGVHREEPRRLGVPRRPRALRGRRRRTLLLPLRPARRHVHRGRSQRVPGRDRVGARRASGRSCPAWSSASPTTIWARCRTRWSQRLAARRGGGARVSPRTPGGPQGAAHGRVRRPAAARRGGQGEAVGGARGGHLATGLALRTSARLWGS